MLTCQQKSTWQTCFLEEEPILVTVQHLQALEVTQPIFIMLSLSFTTYGREILDNLGAFLHRQYKEDKSVEAACFLEGSREGAYFTASGLCELSTEARQKAALISHIEREASFYSILMKIVCCGH